jgi:hypothetical protein
VTLRLETPVLYFYPQRGFALEQSIDVRVRFNGGWLTEFYPAAWGALSSSAPRNEQRYKNCTLCRTTHFASYRCTRIENRMR